MLIKRYLYLFLLDYHLCISLRKVFAICFALFVNALNVGFLFLAQHLHNILNKAQQITKKLFYTNFAFKAVLRYPW